MRRWRLKAKIVSLPKMVAARSQSATISSSPSVLASATISPSGLTKMLPPITGETVLGAARCHRDDPGRVLIGAGLERQSVVEHALFRPLVCLLRIDRGRVVAEHDQLHALQSHDAIGLGPSPIVADTHADNAAHGSPDWKTEVAGLEITLLQVLEGTLRIELGMARQMHLAILAHDLSVPVDQDRRVEMMAIGRELGITERQPDAIFSGLLEQRTRRSTRHLAFEPGVYFRRLCHVPAREKGGKRKLGINYEIALLGFGLIEQIEHAPHDRLPAVRLVGRAHLAAANPKHSAHKVLLLLTRRSGAPAGGSSARSATA